jgi:hypothetical protein
MRTDTEKLHTVVDNLPAIQVFDLSKRGIAPYPVCVFHSPAPDAVNMAMSFHEAVKPRFRTARFQLANQAHADKELQVPVHRAQADSRQTLSDNPVEHGCSGVRVKPAKFFQNHLTLFGVSPESFSRHKTR